MNKRKPIIVLDIDGVLFQTTADAVATYNQRFGTKHAVEDIFDHNARHNEDLFVVDGVDQFHVYQDDISGYVPVPGAVAALKNLARSAELIALTSRDYDRFYEATKKAIQNHFGDTIKQVYFTTQAGSLAHREKGEIIKELGGALLVDDSVAYCLSCQKLGIPAILFGQPYNKAGHDYPAELRAKDWPHAEAIARRLLEL